MTEGEKVGEEAGEEYESDIDAAPLPVARRRAAASDDEEEDDEGGGGGGRRGSPVPWTVSYSDSDGQGAAELYDDDEEDVYGTEDEECEDVYEEPGAGGGGGGGEAEMVMGVVVAVAQEDEGKCKEEEEAVQAGVEKEKLVAVGEVEAKKGDEPYAVPAIGPFYMHDNRFQDKENCSRGELFGDKKIWYPKDEAVWVHDRFQEINFHDPQKDNAGVMHNTDHGYPKPIKSFNGIKNFDNVLMQSRSYDGNAKGYCSCKDDAVWLHDRFYEINCHASQHDSVHSHSYDGNAKGCKNASNVYQEKASRTYQSHWTTSRISLGQDNRSKHTEPSSNASVGKCSSQTSKPTPLNSSRSYHRDPPFVQGEKARVVKFTKLFSSAVRMAHNSLTPQSYPILRKKAFVPSVGYGNSVDPSCMVPIEVISHSALHSVSTSDNYSKYSVSRNQGKGLDIAKSANMTICLTSTPATTPYAQPHNEVYQKMPLQPPNLPTRTALAQKSSGTNKIQSPTQTTLTNSAKDGDVSTTAPTEPNNSTVLSEVKVCDDMKETDSTFSLDGGDHVLGVTGASGFSLGDRGSTGIPAKLPVMLFRGPGFPSVVMNLQGLVCQKLGGNSEMGLMTWLPILADSTVVLEGTHTAPCVSTNCPQLSELASPRDHSATKDSISLPSQDTSGHELVRHQNRPRRYSEMSFAL